MENSILFRIQTEDINVNYIEDVASQYFVGFTLIHGTGYWKGQKEGSLTIEVLGSPEDRIKIHTLAESIKTSNKQEAVLVSESVVKSILI